MREGARNCIKYTFSFQEKDRELNSPDSWQNGGSAAAWIEEEETIVLALPITVTPVPGIVS